MVWSFSFLSRLGKRLRPARMTKSQGKRRTSFLRLAVEELEPRILLAQRPAVLPSLLPHPSTAHVGQRAVPGPQALLLPGTPGQTVRAVFTLTARQSNFRNEAGLFLVDDASGRIGTVQPGDRGYAAAAMSRAQVLFARGGRVGSVNVLDLPAGRHFGLYLIQNATTAAFRA